MTYRLFVEDVGRGRFSAMGLPDVEILAQFGSNNPLGPTEAIKKGFGASTWNGKRIIALPHDRADLWPNGQTGEVPPEALDYR